ncbi:MAG: DUF2341 domain-containing protein [Planctomycetes bacterium]|nr:DUF2341 domain-containing protein [Planctomycetota bacterium]
MPKKLVIGIICVICVICGYGGLCERGNTGSSGPGTLSDSSAPVAVTVPADNITFDSARLNGTVSNPFGLETSGWFEWGAVTPYTNATAHQYLGFYSAAEPLPLSVDLTGLTISTTYYCRIVAQNPAGTKYGQDLSFSTWPAAPAEVTTPAPEDKAVNIGVNQQLSWSAASGAASYDVYFGTVENQPAFKTNTVSTTYNAGMLIYGTTYWWQVYARNERWSIPSAVWSFSTAPQPAPGVTANWPTNVTPGSATLQATANPNGAPTTAYFQYGLDTNFGLTTTPQALGNGYTSINVTADISGLTSNKTYYYRLVASNSAGMAYGSNRLFNTSNNTPILTAIGDKAVNENTNLSFTVTAVDPDAGDSIGYSATGLPPGASFNSSNGLFQWTPSYDQAGSYPGVKFRATDNWGDYAEETIAITVNNVNRAPALTAVGNKTVNENTLLTFTVAGSDPDAGDTLTYSATGLPAGAVFTPTTRAFGWTPDYDQAGSYPDVKFRVTDTGGLWAEEAITITVNNVDRPPVLTNPGNQIVNEGGNLPFTLAAIDPDGGAITYSMTSTPTGATLNAVSGAFNWSPNYSQSGNYNVVFTAHSSGLTDSEPIWITVNNVNRPPVLTEIGNRVADEGVAISFVITGTDDDGDGLTYTASNLPSGASFTPATRTFDWTPSYTQSAVYNNVTFRVTDNGSPNLYAEEVISITVQEVNQTPVLEAIGNKTADEGVELAFVITATDADAGDVLTYSSALPPGASLNSTSGLFQWTPSSTQSGVYPDIAFTATDNGSPNLSDSEAITITVNNTISTPTVNTTAATNITISSAQLNGTVNPNGAASAGWFEWGLTAAYGNTTSAQSLGSGAVDVAVTATLTALSPGATYNFRAVANNPSGTTYGQNQQFTTGNLTNPGGGTWAFYKPITITNTGATDYTDYQVMLEPFRDTGECLNDGINNTGLVGSWAFSEGTGNTTADASGSGNTGNLAAAPNDPTWTAAGRYGNGLSFDGVDDYVQAPDSNNWNFGAGNFTIETWFKFNKQSAQQGLVAQYVDGNNLWLLVINSSNEISFFNNSPVINFATSGAGLQVGQWYHIVMARNGSNWNIYVNGVSKGSTSVSLTMPDLNAPLIFGQYGGSSYFGGLMDEVKIYNRALSVEEISTRYGSGLVGSWHFSEGAGSIATDSTDYRNNGTLSPTATGPTWVDGRFGKALSFDGVDDYVDVGNKKVDLLSNWTISLWQKKNGAGYQGEYFSHGSSSNSAYPYWLIRIDAADSNNDYLSISSRNDDTSALSWTSVSFPKIDNGWHYIVYVKNGSVITGYVDGVQIAEAINLIAGTYNNINISTIGALRRQTYIESLFNGTIDEVQIFNRALSASEIITRYNGGTPKVRHDYADVRFTNSDGSQELPFWQETDSRFWLKVPTLGVGSNTIRMYYGNSSATNSSNIGNTFAFGDDFNSYTDGTLNGQGNWSGDSDVEVQGTTVSEGIKAIKVKNTASANIYRYFLASGPEDGEMICRMCGLGTTGYVHQLILGENASGAQFYFTFADGNISMFESGAWQLIQSFAVNTWYTVQLQWRTSDDKWRAKINNGDWTVWRANAWGVAWTKIDYIRFASNTPGSNGIVDTIRIRKTSSIEPTAVLGNQVVINSETLSNSNNNPWSNYRTITVTNNTATDYTDYQVMLEPFRDTGDFVGDNLAGFGAGPVGAWSFSEGTGITTADASGNGNTGNLAAAPNNPTWTAAGRFGNGLSFDGVDDYVDVPDSASLDITGDLTIEFWVNPSLSTDHRVIAKWGTVGYRSYIVSITSAGLVFLGISSDGGANYCFRDSDNGAIAANVWQHITAVYKTGAAGYIYIYVNGKRVDTTTSGSFQTSIYNSDTPLMFGKNYNDDPSGNWFGGLLDEVKIYNRALTAEEVSTRYGSGLVGSWHFSEGSGTSVADMSGNGNNGTLAAAPNDPTWTTSGRFGNALSFDGTDDYVNVSDNNSLDFGTGDFTIELWVYPDVLQDAKYLIMKGDYGQSAVGGWDLHLRNVGGQQRLDGRLYAGSNAKDWTSSLSLNIGAYNHIVWIRTSSGFNVYINGTEDTNLAIDGAASYGSNVNNDYNLMMGVYNNLGATYYFDGSLDETRIYNRALSASEIVTRYNAGTPKLRHDYADVRFTSSDGSQEYSFWQEMDSRFWLKVPTLGVGSNTIRMYYGNVSATASSSGASTFDFFDDFDDGAIDGAKWQAYDLNGGAGAATEADGVMKLTVTTNGSAPVALPSVPTFANGVLELRSKVVVASPTVHILPRIRYDGNDPIEVVLRGAGNSDMYFHDGATKGQVSFEDINANINRWYFMRVGFNGSDLSLFAKNLSTGFEKATTATTGITAANPIGLGFWSATSEGYYDDVRVRKYAAVEPASAPPGPEQ